MIKNKIVGHLGAGLVSAILIINLNTPAFTMADIAKILPVWGENTTETAPTPSPSLSPRISRILADLRPCESGGRDWAVNEVDLDNTASYGRYQFKPSTLQMWGLRYEILPKDIEPAEIMNVIMDGELQEKILIEAIKENGYKKSFWMGHFPGCSEKYRFWEYTE